MLSVLLFLTAYCSTVLLISSSRVIFMNNFRMDPRCVWLFPFFFCDRNIRKSKEHSSIRLQSNTPKIRFLHIFVKRWHHACCIWSLTITTTVTYTVNNLGLILYIQPQWKDCCFAYGAIRHANYVIVHIHICTYIHIQHGNCWGVVSHQSLKYSG